MHMTVIVLTCAFRITFIPPQEDKVAWYGRKGPQSNGSTALVSVLVMSSFASSVRKIT